VTQAADGVSDSPGSSQPSDRSDDPSEAALVTSGAAAALTVATAACLTGVDEARQQIPICPD
jgi:hypothetical protein